MKKTKGILLGLTSGLVLVTAMSLSAAWAQDSPTRHSVSGQQPDQPDPAPGEKTFSGKIMKSGNKLVLAAATTKTTYQLDDQDKAKQFLGKDVKVTGILDAASGTIRVTRIEPAA